MPRFEDKDAPKKGEAPKVPTPDEIVKGVQDAEREVVEDQKEQISELIDDLLPKEEEEALRLMIRENPLDI